MYAFHACFEKGFFGILHKISNINIYIYHIIRCTNCRREVCLGWWQRWFGWLNYLRSTEYSVHILRSTFDFFFTLLMIWWATNDLFICFVDEQFQYFNDISRESSFGITLWLFGRYNRWQDRSCFSIVREPLLALTFSGCK